MDAELLPVLQKGIFTVLDLEDHPLCCGFFVRESGVALTVRHGHKRFLRAGNKVRAAMLRHDLDDVGGAAAAIGVDSSSSSSSSNNIAALSAAALPGEVLLEFEVHSFSPEGESDYTCMILTSAPPTGTFQPLTLPSSRLADSQLTGAHATLLHGSIALNRQFNKQPSASLVPCTIFTTHSDIVLYTAATSGGDSGGALVLHGKTLVGMHTEGVNDVPEDIDLLSPSDEPGRRHKRIKLSEASPSTTGAALRLDGPNVQAAISAAHQHVMGSVQAALR